MLNIVPTLVPGVENTICLCRPLDSLIPPSKNTPPCLAKVFYELGFHTLAWEEIMHIEMTPGKKNVQSPTAHDVNKMLRKANSKTKQKCVEMINTTLDRTERWIVADFLSQSIDAYDAVRDVLQQTNLFRKVEKINSKDTTTMTSVRDCQYIYSGKLDFPTRFPQPIIVPKNHEEKTLAMKLGAIHLTMEEIIKITLQKDTLSPDERRTLCFYVLSNADTMTNSKHLLDLVKETSFVKTKDKKYQKPCNLYDSADDLAKRLFAGEPRFPCEDPDRIALLKESNMLRTHQQIEKSHILETCKLIHQCSEEPSSHDKAEALLDIAIRISDVSQLITSETTQHLRWVPFVQDRPMHYPMSLPWFKSNSLCTPRELILTEEGALICGSICPTVDPRYSIRLRKIGREPTHAEVIRHFTNVIQNFAPNELEEYKMVTLGLYIDTCRNPK